MKRKKKVLKKSNNVTVTYSTIPTWTTHSTAAPAFESHAGFSEDEVKAVLRFFNLPDKDYFEWMNGQSCPILPNGQIGYYWYDLHRYIEWRTKGVKPEFD
jgi:hypothetical protein